MDIEKQACHNAQSINGKSNTNIPIAERAVNRITTAIFPEKK